MTTPDLTVTAVAGGINLDGGQDVNGYELHADTRGTAQITWRKQSVDNPWVEGSYDVLAVRGNVTETVAVWVYGGPRGGLGNNGLFRQRLIALEALVSSSSWSLVWTVGDLTENWDCTYSDYAVETQREFQYATQGIFRAQVVRRPSVVRSGAGWSGTN